MRDAQVAALRETAGEGVEFDGLTVSRTDSGLRFAVPGATYEGLDRAGFEDAARTHPSYVTEWHVWRRQAPQEAARWTFLRWLEDADEVPAPERSEYLTDGHRVSWGQLSIEVRRHEAGRREYTLRHVDDEGVEEAALRTETDPLATQEIRRTDDQGNYRPLSTAPTLPTGWRVVDLDATGILEAVEACYPATIANWYRERRDELDVTHWRATAERQTGIYDLVDELPRAGVEALAAACCVDSQCLKRRAWDHHDGPEGELAADRGGGEFPCREPCSLVIAAAREFVKTERESTVTYELELRPREKAHLERLVEAVAEGDLAGVETGRVTDPANRLRTRYLEARLFEDGDLPATGEHSDVDADAGRSPDHGDD